MCVVYKIKYQIHMSCNNGHINIRTANGARSGGVRREDKLKSIVMCFGACRNLKLSGYTIRILIYGLRDLHSLSSNLVVLCIFLSMRHFIICPPFHANHFCSIFCLLISRRSSSRGPCHVGCCFLSYRIYRNSIVFSIRLFRFTSVISNEWDTFFSLSVLSLWPFRFIVRALYNVCVCVICSVRFAA